MKNLSIARAFASREKEKANVKKGRNIERWVKFGFVHFSAQERFVLQVTFHRSRLQVTVLLTVM